MTEEHTDFYKGLANITYLSPLGYGISSLRGIKYFTALNLLKNTKLKTLQCYSNQIKGIYMDLLIASFKTTSTIFRRFMWAVISADIPCDRREKVNWAQICAQSDSFKRRFAIPGGC